MHGDRVALLEGARSRFGADARVPQLLFGILGVEIEHVERHLTVDRDRLNLLDDRLARALEQGPSLPPDVVHVQGILLPKIEPARRDHRVRPAHRVGVRYLERPLFAVTRRRRLHEQHDAILVTELEVTIGEDDARRAGA